MNSNTKPVIRYFPLLLCFVFTPVLFGQIGQEKFELSGKVVEKFTGEPLLGVNILISGQEKGTFTDENGYFSIELQNGNYEVLFSALGYGTFRKEIFLDRDLTLKIFLERTTESLEEVVIQENVERQKIDEPQMSVSTLTTETIKQVPAVLGEVDVIKSLLLLPEITNTGEGSSGFNVRGGSAGQNLVLLDGARLYSVSHLFGFFSIFNPDAVESVKLYSGGIPPRFGGRISSVLKIDQKEGDKQEFHGNGGIGVVSSRLLLEGPIVEDKLSFLVAGRSSYAHLFLPLFGLDNTAYFYDFNTKLAYELDENNSLSFSAYFGRDIFEIEDSFRNDFGNTALSANWEHDYSKNLIGNLSAAYSRYDYGLDLALVGFVFKNGVEDFSLKYDFQRVFSNDFSIRYGLGGIYYQFNPGEILPSSEASGINPQKLTDKFALEGAGYVQANLEITEKLSVLGGVRFSVFNRLGQDYLNRYAHDNPVIFNQELGIYEKAEPIGRIEYERSESIQTFSNLEPRVSLAYQLNGQSSIKAGYQRMAQYIHLISNTSAPTPFDVYAPSGKYIEPMLSDQISLGYFRNFEGFSLSAETYFKKTKNRLDYIPGADLIANNAIEQILLSGEARAYGLELLLRKTTGDWQGWISYTLSKSEQRTPGRSPEETGINNGEWYNSPWDKTHDIAVTATYRLSNKWTFGANFIFQTGQPATFPNGQYELGGLVVPVFGQRNSSRLPAYHRLDISATLTPKKNKNRNWQGEWVFGIYNVYNRMNAASISFGQNEDTLENEAVKLSIFGIIPSVTYNFKF